MAAEGSKEMESLRDDRYTCMILVMLQRTLRLLC